MNKKTAIAGLVLSLALFLVGCKGKQDEYSVSENQSEVISLNDENVGAEDNTSSVLPAESGSEPLEETDLENGQSITEEQTEGQTGEEHESFEEEEEQREAEEEQRKAEEKKQQNAFSMMYYLAITAEEIRTKRNNRIMLEDIYTSLINDINPGAVDERTQEHLENLRDIIKKYRGISVKRDRLQFIYNKNKAEAIRSVVPNPLAIFSVTNSMDWKRLAVAVVYTAIDSYNSFESASENADLEFLMSGWELDDEETETVQRNRDRAFDYMVDMVREFKLDGLKTLSEKNIEKFAEICKIEAAPEKIRRLVSEEETYQLLGNYWLELTDSYFEASKYKECLQCVDRYIALATGIYRQDFSYAGILPKAIVAARNVYEGEEYISSLNKYTEDLLKNTPKDKDHWSQRYFAAQVYLDLYTRTNAIKYLEDAYEILYDNVIILLPEQRNLNNAYLSEYQEATIPEPDYRFMSDAQKKEKEKEFKEEKKRLEKYNKAMKEARKTELPSLYEPLILNCEVLFEIAKQLNISDSDKKELEEILGPVFISKTISDIYSFSNEKKNYNISFDKKEIVIAADLLTAGSTIMVTVEDNGSKTVFDDCKVENVFRSGNGAGYFSTHFSSKKMKKYEWTANSKVTIEVMYTDVYNKSDVYNFSVSKFQEHWYGDDVEFRQE